MLGSAHTMALRSPVGLGAVYLEDDISCSLISDMDAEYLKLSSGVIWTALNIDYPGHSFSHLGVFFGSSLF
jgi:hypothetical protein